jgi:hypothetical protein
VWLVNEKQAAEIDALMKQHDVRTGKRGDDQRAQEEFGMEFGRLRCEVIKPAMEQVIAKLATGGHQATIGEAKTSEASADPNHAGSIRLEILPAGAKRERYTTNELPGVTFSAEHGMKVGVYSRSGRPDEEHGAGPLRRYRLSDITPEMVTTEIVEILKKTF